jgi:hypothetical protein
MVLVHCHAGCRQEQVIQPLQELGLWSVRPNAKRTIVAEYNYSDEAGKLLFQVIRYEPKTSVSVTLTGPEGGSGRRVPGRSCTDSPTGGPEWSV